MTKSSINNNIKTSKLKKDSLPTTKIRGTHARVQRVKVTPVRKNLNAAYEKQFRNCIRCKESSNSVKLLSERIDRIEQLVNELAKTTQNFSKVIINRKFSFLLREKK